MCVCKNALAFVVGYAFKIVTFRYSAHTLDRFNLCGIHKMTSRLFGMVSDLIFSDCSATSFGCFSAEWCSIQNHRILIFENSFLVVFLLVFHCWSSNWCVSGRFLFCVSASSQVQYAGKKRFFDQSKRWLSSLWFERIVILVKQRWMHCAVGRKFIVVFQKMKHRINVTFLLCWLFGCLIAFFVFFLFA